MAMLPSPIYKSMGADVAQLKSILSIKLTMDDRRPNAFQQARKNRGGKAKTISWATLGTMFLSALMGGMFVFSFLLGENDVTRLTIYFSFFIFFLASILITDFTSVLIDIRDNYIILPKPVNDKTFVLSRLLHILIHVCKLVIPMSLGGLIMMGYRHGAWGVIVLFVMIILATLFSIFLINALYILILKVTTPEKFKNIISYFQILFTICFYAGYQVVPRMIDKAVFQQLDVNNYWFSWLAPSYWFANGWQFFYSFPLEIKVILGCLLSIAVPLLSIWVVIKYFAPSFTQKLSMIGGSEGGETAQVRVSRNGTNKTTISERLAKIFTRGSAERMGFILTWKMTTRSRDFKMKVYPSLGYILVYVVLVFMRGKHLSLEDIQSQTGAGRIIILGVMYFSSFIMFIALGQLAYSDKYKAAWVYFITPIKTPGNVLLGSIKSIIAKFYLPIAILTSVIAFALIGGGVVINLLLGLFNQLLIFGVVGYLSLRTFPFSQQQNMSSKTSNFIRGIFTFLVPVFICMLHYFAYPYWYITLAFCILSAIATYVVMDSIKNKTMAEVGGSYQE